MSAVLALESYNTYFGNPNSSLQGGISSTISAGSFLGSLIYMFTGDRFGRRGAATPSLQLPGVLTPKLCCPRRFLGTIMLGCLVWFVGCIIQTASQDVPMLIVGRIIAGLCIGLVSSAVPVYQSEVSVHHVWNGFEKD